ncbi:MAG: hypothetical protein AB8G77_18620 [Rhodothermales bacterium]
MTVWDYNIRVGDLALDFALLSTFLLLGFVCRRYIPFFQKFLIPSALVAGFAGLLLGPEILSLIDFDTERMAVYIYHLLALTFIGIGLQGSGEKRSKSAVHVGFMFIMSYLLQIIVGLGIALAIVYLVNPDLIPAVGMLLPLGFGMGPGIAYSIGQSWSGYGFTEGASVGLTISAFGFLIAYFSGMIIVNRGLRRGKSSLLTEEASLTKEIRTGVIEKTPLPEAGKLQFFGGTIEPLAFHLALIGALYLLTFLVTYGIELTMRAGGIEKEIATLWGFHFIIANLLALGSRKIMNRVKAGYLVDFGLMNRLTGTLTDYMITASIMAISLSVAWDYLIPIMLICFSGAFVTYFAIKFTAYRTFDELNFERFAGVYGEMTGNISSGLALVRVMDPDFKTPVAQDLGLGSGVALLFGFPLLIVINLPFGRFDGALLGYWVVLGICVVYLGLIFLLWKRIGFTWHKKGQD